MDHVGRIEGQVVRRFPGGFAIEISATPRKRDKLATALTWLANRNELNLPEDRRHDRFVPTRQFSRLTFPDGVEMQCRIIDMSLSGAAVSIAARPPVGSIIMLGQLRGQVVRHFAEGIAIEFATIQDRDLVEDRLG